MTTRDKEDRRADLFTECLGIYMEGTILDLRNQTILLCKKYFPNCDIFFMKSCFEFFSILRDINHSYYKFNSNIDNYGTNNSHLYRIKKRLNKK